MEPFDRYPNGGKALLGPLLGSNARKGYGLRLQRLTGVNCCAYCGLDLTATYEQWLLMQVDHVVPVSVAVQLGIPDTFYKDMVNCVLACAACNGFDNRFTTSTPMREPEAVWTLAAFVSLRDAIFEQRHARVSAIRADERAFFDPRLWLPAQAE